MLNAEARLLLSDLEVEVTPQGVVFTKDTDVRFSYTPDVWARLLRLCSGTTDLFGVESVGFGPLELRFLASEDDTDDCVWLWDGGDFVFCLDLRTWHFVTDVTSSVLGLNGR